VPETLRNYSVDRSVTQNDSGSYRMKRLTIGTGGGILRRRDGLKMKVKVKQSHC
jgi:hypothetical protein